MGLGAGLDNLERDAAGTRKIIYDSNRGNERPQDLILQLKIPMDPQKHCSKNRKFGRALSKRLAGPDRGKYSLYVLRSIQSTNIKSAGKTWNFFMLNLVVHKVTTRLYCGNLTSS